MSLEFPPSKARKKRRNKANPASSGWRLADPLRAWHCKPLCSRNVEGKGKTGGATELEMWLLKSKIWTDVVSEMEACGWWTETVLPLSGMRVEEDVLKVPYSRDKTQCVMLKRFEMGCKAEICVCLNLLLLAICRVVRLLVHVVDSSLATDRAGKPERRGSLACR